MSGSVINLSYIIASILFVIGIKMLGSAKTARKGNMLSSIGMLLAIVVTLLDAGLDYTWIITAFHRLSVSRTNRVLCRCVGWHSLHGLCRKGIESRPGHMA